MVRNLLFSIYLWLKALFGTKIEGTDVEPNGSDVPSSWAKEQKKGFWDIYNVDAEDKIDYTNTHEDHHSNYKHLDDIHDERSRRISEQVGLKYEEDGKTPLNASEVFDMTYEQYEEYRK